MILQILVGRKINDVFWFQFNLIFISVIILIVTFIFPEKLTYHFLILLAVFAYIFDLKEYNSKIFSQYNINISHSIGRLSICYIFSINGYLLGSFNLLRKLNHSQKLKVLLLSPFIFHILKEIHVINKFFSKIKLLRFNLSFLISFILIILNLDVIWIINILKDI